MKVKFFKKKDTVKNAEPVAPEPEEEDVIENADGYVEDEEGNQIPLSELVALYKEKQKENSAGSVMNMDDEVEVDGEKMTVKELMAACGYGPKKENAESPIDDAAEEPVDEKKQMSNSKAKNDNFKKIENAAGAGQKVKREINTETTRLARGAYRYGTPVAQGGK